MEFTRSDAKAMREEINKALADIAKKYNSDIKVGNIKYGATIEAKITFAKIKEGMFGDYVNSKEAINFQSMEHKHGIPKDALNQEFEHAGDTFKITGYNPRAHRYPITYLKNGKAYKCGKDYMYEIVKMSLPSVML
jgi:hypothetical protein